MGKVNTHTQWIWEREGEERENRGTDEDIHLESQSRDRLSKGGRERRRLISSVNFMTFSRHFRIRDSEIYVSTVLYLSHLTGFHFPIDVLESSFWTRFSVGRDRWCSCENWHNIIFSIDNPAPFMFFFPTPTPTSVSVHFTLCWLKNHKSTMLSLTPLIKYLIDFTITTYSKGSKFQMCNFFSFGCLPFPPHPHGITWS